MRLEAHTIENPLSRKVELGPTLDVIDAAKYLNVSKYTVINRIKQGKLKAYKQGIYWKIKREWLLEYEASLITNHDNMLELGVFK
ncbi:helix-turn-helix domain-containing protein [Paenibacillus sp. FSL W7-1279]|uniref:helix-turn-helix domain-containing protein n=1 Tax=Paenibacillus sp. FSL W7-1279 TaxID=2921697 RepID=UPI0030D8C5CD